MSYSTKNLFTNQNFSISNSIILNNYSIQNLIFTPSHIDNYGKFQINSNNYYHHDNQCSFSRTPKKPSLINIIPNGLERTNLFKITPPLPSYKSTNKLKLINIKSIPIDNKNKGVIHKIIPISKCIKHIEKHPQDSVSKKNKNKRNKIIERNNNLKIIKSSKSTNVIGTIDHFWLDLNRTKKDFSFPKNSKPKKKKIPHNNSKTLIFDPKTKLNLKEFIFGEQIGNGTFGKIFSVKWVNNNKNYAMKKEILTDIEDVEKRRNTCKIIQNFIKNTKCKGVIHLYGNLCFKNNKHIDNININNNFINLINETHFIYYELMEKAQRDWDKEINIRRQYKLYYTEKELLNIMTQLITTLSLLEKNHITHRDIKPQNILVLNGEYKLGDFGEIRVLKREGLIVQRVRGSELYMSPILFHGLHLNLIQVKHNTYKSDVFSLGMCLFYAASLTYCGVDSIRELIDMKKIKDILFQFLSRRYSDELIMFILSMLEIDENKRLNFIQLEKKLKKFY